MKIIEKNRRCGHCDIFVLVGIECEICNVWFHHPCVRISRFHYELLNSVSGFHWNCHGCDKVFAMSLSYAKNKIKKKCRNQEARSESISDCELTCSKLKNGAFSNKNYGSLDKNGGFLVQKGGFLNKNGEFLDQHCRLLTQNGGYSFPKGGFSKQKSEVLNVSSPHLQSLPSSSGQSDILNGGRSELINRGDLPGCGRRERGGFFSTFRASAIKEHSILLRRVDQIQSRKSLTRKTNLLAGPSRPVVELIPKVENIYRNPGTHGQCAVFSPDESLFAWSCGLRTLSLIPWDPIDSLDVSAMGQNFHKDQVSIDCGYTVSSLTFGGGARLVQDGQQHFQPILFDATRDLMLVTGHSNGRIRVWDPYSGKLLLELTDHRYSVNCLSFATDRSMRLVSGSDDGTIKVWDLLDGGNLVKTLKDTKLAPIKDVAWSPDSKMLCAVGIKQKVVLYSMDEYILEKRLSGHSHDVMSCSFSPDGALLATASSDTTAIIWDVETGLPLRQLHHLLPKPGLIYMSGANSHQVSSIDFAPNGCQVASTCSDGFLRIWDLTDPNEEADNVIGTSEEDVMLSCKFSPGGGALAVSYSSGRACVHSPELNVPSLLHCSRMAIRRAISSMKKFAYNDCELPRTLIPFLQYKKW